MNAEPAQSLTFTGIGASQAAAAVGLDPWTAPIALYERLTSAVDDREETSALRWGKLLEQPIRKAYVETIGRTVHVPRESLFHPEHQWRRATPDGIVLAAHDLAETRWEWGLEVKTAFQFAADQWGPSGSDDVPIHYWIQCAWSMHVCDLDRWDLAALIGGRDFRIYTLRRDREFEDNLVDAVTSFWADHVLRREPPPIDHTTAFRGYLERRFPETRQDYVPADADAEALVRTILQRRDAMATLKRDDARDCNALCASIGEAAGLITSLGKVHWKPQRPRTTIDWKAVAEEVARFSEWTDEELAKLAAEKSREGKPSRPLRLPRAKGASVDDEGE
jgi:putative phage-type endonuclease